MTGSLADVVRDWFAAHAAGDLARAEALLSPHFAVTVDGTRLKGFEKFVRWYADRSAAEGEGFSYELVDLLGGNQHAAAALRLRRADGTSWRQVALYAVEGGMITGITAFEDAHPPPSG